MHSSPWPSGNTMGNGGRLRASPNLQTSYHHCLSPPFPCLVASHDVTNPLCQPLLWPSSPASQWTTTTQGLARTSCHHHLSLPISSSTWWQQGKVTCVAITTALISFPACG